MKKFKKEFQISTKHGTFRVFIWWDDRDKAYLVKAVNLPEVVTFGTSLVDAKRMAKDALELYCLCAIDEGKLVIDDEGKIVGERPRARVISLRR